MRTDTTPIVAETIRPQRAGPRGRGGNAIIEMAIVLPLLTFLGMGMAEFGQYFYIRSAFEAAARDACRAAIVDSAQQGDPAAAATATLAQAGITFQPSWMYMCGQVNNGFQFTVTDCSTVGPGVSLGVFFTVNYAQLPNAFRPLSTFCGIGISTGKTISCRSIMVKE